MGDASANAVSMDCPSCGSPMRRGVAEIRGRLLYALLIYGISYQPLWWSADGEERQLMMLPRSPREAFRCGSCSTLVLTPPPPPPPPLPHVPNELARTVFKPQPWRKRKG